MVVVAALAGGCGEERFGSRTFEVEFITEPSGAKIEVARYDRFLAAPQDIKWELISGGRTPVVARLLPYRWMARASVVSNDVRYEGMTPTPFNPSSTPKLEIELKRAQP